MGTGAVSVELKGGIKDECLQGFCRMMMMEKSSKLLVHFFSGKKNSECLQFQLPKSMQSKTPQFLCDIKKCHSACVEQENHSVRSSLLNPVELQQWPFKCKNECL